MNHMKVKIGIQGIRNGGIMRDNRKRDQRAALMFAGIFIWICRERDSEMNNW